MSDQPLNWKSYPLLPRLAVGAVVVHQRRLLLVERKQPPAQGGWTLPGGLVEVGESLEQAVRREIQEECGLIVQPTRMLDTVEWIERDSLQRTRHHYVIIDYLATYVSGELRAGTDAAAARWAAAEELPHLPMPELARRFIARHHALIWSPTMTSTETEQWPASRVVAARTRLPHASNRQSTKRYCRDVASPAED